MKKTFIPNQEAIIEQELRDSDHARDLRWVSDLLEKTEKKLEKAEYDYQNSGGYGSRANITRYDKEVRLCRLALRGLEHSCYRCDLRWRNIRSFVSSLEAEKKEGFDKIDIDRAIDLIKSLF